MGVGSGSGRMMDADEIFCVRKFEKKKRGNKEKNLFLFLIFFSRGKRVGKKRGTRKTMMKCYVDGKLTKAQKRALWHGCGGV